MFVRILVALGSVALLLQQDAGLRFRRKHSKRRSAQKNMAKSFANTSAMQAIADNMTLSAKAFGSTSTVQADDDNATISAEAFGNKSINHVGIQGEEEANADELGTEAGGEVDKLKFVGTDTFGNDGVLKEATENKREESDEKEDRRKRSKGPDMKSWTPEKVFAYYTWPRWSKYMTKNEVVKELNGLWSLIGRLRDRKLSTVTVLYGPTVGSDAKIEFTTTVQDAIPWVQKVAKQVPVDTKLRTQVKAIADRYPEGPPADIIKAVLSEVETQLPPILEMARNIRREDYSLISFWKDCERSFPELRLYMVGGQAEGRPSEDEYQRTVGALFAVYWFFRWAGGGAFSGKEQFCYGVDNAWNPMKRRRVDHTEVAGEGTAFLDLITPTMDIPGLLDKAGLGDSRESESRTQAMLVLTAIHDVMKMDKLKSTMSTEAEHWRGYETGERILNHDDALAYVLEFHPDLLPSYNALQTETSKKAIIFSQNGFNMGWFVQAEAPPGKTLKQLKAHVSEPAYDEKDMNFYFVHWLTDLAAGAGTPLGGCELFVGFQDKVVPFFDAFALLKTDLKEKTETEVFEKYLRNTFGKEEGTFGSLKGSHPDGTIDTVQMRLAVMAGSKDVLTAFSRLGDDDRNRMRNELAMTGDQTQQYSDTTLDAEYQNKGPAFLLYYAPALLKDKIESKDERKKVPDDDKESFYRATLEILSQVYFWAREARQEWKLTDGQAGTTVEIKCDALKKFFMADTTSVQDIDALAKSNTIRVGKDGMVMIQSH